MDEAQDVVIQGDGKILVAGGSAAGSYDGYISLARYQPNGAPDTSFGNGGVVKTPIFNPNNFVQGADAFGVAVQPDGKIVAAGRAWAVTAGWVNGLADGDGRIAVVRYDANGTLDPNFGAGGIVLLNLGGGQAAAGVELLPDGKILIAGERLGGTYAARLKSDGSLDPDYGTNGGYTPSKFRAFQRTYGMTVDPGGKVIAVGLGANFGQLQALSVTRFAANGLLDTSFDGDGYATLDMPGVASTGTAAVVQPDGSIVVGGTLGTQNGWILARFKPDGSRDTSFGNGGAVLFAPFNALSQLRDLTLQPDGKVVAVGFFLGSTERPLVARFNTNGTLDTTFDGDGLRPVDSFTGATLVGGIFDAVALQSNGRIVAAGNRGVANLPWSNFLVARLLGNAPPVVAREQAVVAVEKGQTASNTGTFSDPDGNATVTLTATRGGAEFGTVIGNATNGTWYWEAPTGSLALGDHPVTITATDDSGAMASTSFTLAVNPAATTTAITAPTITYGQQGSVAVTVASALGTVTGNVALSVDGGSPFTLPLVNGSALFTLPGLTATTHSLVANYTAQGDFASSTKTGSLTVTPAPLSVVVDDKRKVYGAVLPVLTGTLTGLVDGDGITASYGTTATAASNVVVGGYPITATLHDPNNRLGNYAVTTTPGTLTITKADQTINWADPADIVYGTPLGGTQLNATVSVVGPSPAGALTYSPAAGTVLAGGVGQTLTVTAAETDNYKAASASVVIDVTPATLTVTAGDQSRVYGAANPALTFSITGFVNGETAAVLGGTPALSTAATAASPVGTYPINAALGTLAAGNDNYVFVFVAGTLTVIPADTTVTVATPGFATLHGTDDVLLSAAVSVVTPGAGSPTGTVTFYDGDTFLGTTNLAGGVASLPVNRNALSAGVHAITAAYSGDGSFAGSDGTATHTVLAPSTVQGLVYVDADDDGQVDFGETAVAGVTVTLTGTDDLGRIVNRSAQSDSQGVYTFPNLRPSGGAGYTITETQPAGLTDGMDTLGTVGTAVVGSAAVNDTFSGVVLPQGGSYAQDYNFGERQPSGGGSIEHGQTATIGYWQNKNGQNLIKALNGRPTATQLGYWLAATFPNMYGAGAGANNLTGKTNAEVAAFYKVLFARTAQTAAGGGPAKVDAQVLAAALAVYVTNQSLAGTTAAAYGFLVTDNGVGARTFNVGGRGAAFGVAGNSDVRVLDLLLAVNSRSRDGLLYDLDGDGDATDTPETSCRTMANDVFSAINEAGDL